MSKKSRLTAELLDGFRNDPDKLIAIILEQSKRIEELAETVQRQQKRIEELESKLDDSHPGSTAPFRIDQKKRKQALRKPGRSKGHKGHFKSTPQTISNEIVVPLEQCPQCGAIIEEARPVVQYIVDIPKLEPEVTKLITHSGYCPVCKEHVCSGHPIQVSRAEGAARVQVGSRAISMAAQLRYGFGMTLRKCSRVLTELFGCSITPGGLSQSFDRLAAKLSGQYTQLGEQLNSSTVVHTDETSWWVGGPGHSLWVFCNKDITYYRVVSSRSRATFHETIPPDYPGVLVSDCLSVYDSATPHQNKCFSHHLKAISKARDQNGEDPRGFFHQCKSLLTGIITTHKSFWTLETQQQQNIIRSLQLAVDALLESSRINPCEEAIRQRLYKQKDHILSCLSRPGVDPTNNLAERQLRPAVIARKLSCGNKTTNAAKTFQILASLAATFKDTFSSSVQDAVTI